MIPYGAVFRDRYDKEIVMVIGPHHVKRVRYPMRDPEWHAIVVLAGTPGVDYSIEEVPAMRRVTNEARWERIG